MYPLDDDTCSVARSINKFFMKSWWQKMFFFFFFLSPVLGEEEAIMVHAWLPSKEAKRPWWKFPLFGSWQCLGWAWMDLNRLKQIKPSLVPKFQLKYFFGLESWHLGLSQLEPMFFVSKYRLFNNPNLHMDLFILLWNEEYHNHQNNVESNFSDRPELEWNVIIIKSRNWSVNKIQLVQLSGK